MKVEFVSGRSQVARPQRLELSHSGEAHGRGRRAGGGLDTFVTDPAAIRHLDIISCPGG